jgi:hypothetical protein
MPVDLMKKKVGIILKKRQLTKVTCEVALVLDASSSMAALYRNKEQGGVQNITERALAVAATFDDDGVMPVWVFNEEPCRAPDISENSDYENYVRDQIVDNDNVAKWGGTCYSPFIRAVLANFFEKREEYQGTAGEAVSSMASSITKTISGWFSKKKKPEKPSHIDEVPTDPSELPKFVIVITDGDNYTNDIAPTINILKQNADKKIFWSFIGVGDSSFSLLRELNVEIPNLSFKSVSDIVELDDEQFYSELLNEKFSSWFKTFEK